MADTAMCSIDEKSKRRTDTGKDDGTETMIVVVGVIRLDGKWNKCYRRCSVRFTYPTDLPFSVFCIISDRSVLSYPSFVHSFPTTPLLISVPVGHPPSPGFAIEKPYTAHVSSEQMRGVPRLCEKKASQRQLSAPLMNYSCRTYITQQ